MKWEVYNYYAGPHPEAESSHRLERAAYNNCDRLNRQSMRLNLFTAGPYRVRPADEEARAAESEAAEADAAEVEAAQG